MRQFSSWYPLTDSGVREHAPDSAAAVQIRRADGLVSYADGQSAMVCYVYASTSVRESLRKRFADEIEAPGARGQGPLQFRTYGGDDAGDYLRERLYAFDQNFDELPLFNQPD